MSEERNVAKQRINTRNASEYGIGFHGGTSIGVMVPGLAQGQAYYGWHRWSLLYTTFEHTCSLN